MKRKGKEQPPNYIPDIPPVSQPTSFDKLPETQTRLGDFLSSNFFRTRPLSCHWRELQAGESRTPTPTLDPDMTVKLEQHLTNIINPLSPLIQKASTVVNKDPVRISRVLAANRPIIMENTKRLNAIAHEIAGSQNQVTLQTSEGRSTFSLEEFPPFALRVVINQFIDGEAPSPRKRFRRGW